MPRLQCVCDESSPTRGILERQGFKIIWEPRMEGIINDIITEHERPASARGFSREVWFVLVPKGPRSRQAYERPYCGRLAVFARASDDEAAIWYRPEEVDRKEPPPSDRLSITLARGMSDLDLGMRLSMMRGRTSSSHLEALFDILGPPQPVIEPQGEGGEDPPGVRLLVPGTSTRSAIAC